MLNINKLWQKYIYKWTIPQIEDNSNYHPIAIQSRSNRPNSTTPTRIVASNSQFFPHIFYSNFIRNIFLNLL